MEWRTPSSTPRVRSTAPTRAALPSPSAKAVSSRSTARRSTRRRPATSAQRSESSAIASTATRGCSIPPCARDQRARGVSRASSWDEAIELIATRLLEVRERWGGEAILPFSYGGSNGLLTQDTLDAVLFRRFGTSRLARTVCAAPTGVAAQALYGKMPSVTYEDYPRRAAHHSVGRQSIDVGHSSRPVRARRAEARRAARRDRSAIDAARAAGRSAPGAEARHRRRHRARHPSLSVRRRVRRHAVSRRAHQGRRSAARARGGVDVRARRRDIRRSRSGTAAARRRLRAHVARAHPVRVGSRAESQRRQRGDVDSRAAGCRAESSACAAAVTR